MLRASLAAGKKAKLHSFLDRFLARAEHRLCGPKKAQFPIILIFNNEVQLL
jgi:hypothetical protein